MNGLTVVLLILGAGLALLIFNDSSGHTMGMDNDDFARIVYLLPIAAVLSAGVLAGRHGGLGETARMIAIWLVIIMGLMVGYLYRNDFASVGNRLMAGLMPGSAVVTTASDGSSEIILHRAMGGHFQARMEVNGRTVPMLVDTGASSVVLSWDDAQTLGLDPENLSFTVTVSTANGRAMAAPVRLDQMAIGPIVRRDVRAMVASEGRLDESLLGMTFLSTLSSMQIQTDELRLRD
ncbi:TIGR02281 family clan AA aspartic protease [Rhizobiales bacterium RZME27]|uniref:TIGR02281 family clan AA aspartic protease n=1 Tax=Endobacterium cereale TaxID=2663029 RepID=A0A6A8AI32_9HYPH|nr:TIGR02281 family clan AA aspartic protease [Endobacterium cereale]MEB2843868.1 TIGR02281 family clan AA aspartic protease [Endobacterium cereale]MQY49477.1 TIGR02281 family clan AA aspartic protease [Endobacterium cereale]